ncbi:MAG: hypothetical protein RI907_1040 [Pseudomonadota bacterium]|jgi:hypothetical protein
MLLWVLAIMACTSTAMADLRADLAVMAHEPPATVMAEHLVGVNDLARQWPVLDTVMQEAAAAQADLEPKSPDHDPGDDDCGDLPWHTAMSVVGALPLAGGNPVLQQLALTQRCSKLLRPPRLA